jgi:hypothetical protein
MGGTTNGADDSGVLHAEGWSTRVFVALREQVGCGLLVVETSISACIEQGWRKAWHGRPMLNLFSFSLLFQQYSTLFFSSSPVLFAD